MLYWTCAQLKHNRTQLVLHCLALRGFEVYHPRLRVHRRSFGRKILTTPPLFPGYCFVLVVSGWWDARWAPGVIRIVLDGARPARVPDAIVDEIKSCERGGLVELPRREGFKAGEQVRILAGPFEGHLGLYAGMRAHERVLVLLALLGGQQRVELPKADIEAVRS